jgi:hypothetical protein
MADHQSKPNTGVLFKNDRKRDDKDPGYQGTLNIDGKDYWLSAWVNIAQRDGSKYFSLRVRPKTTSKEHNKSDFDDPLK